jgi:hypothetical protein
VRELAAWVVDWMAATGCERNRARELLRAWPQ